MAADQPQAAPAETPSEPFVHLHTHTEYSLLDGAARIKELVAEAARLGQPAVSITDHGVLYGAVEFVAAAKEAGVKPIIGCEVYMAPRSRHDKEGRADRDPNHLILLARDNTGYRNLVTLVSKSHLEGYYYKPRIDKQVLAEHSEGLICLSACIGGELPQSILRGDMDVAESVARQHMEIFGPDNYFLEVQDHGIPEETQIREGLMEIARRTGLPLVCTNDSHYIHSEDAEAHDILLCLQTGARRQDEKRFRFHGPHFYVTGGEEMRNRFAAYPDAFSNTLHVAERCNVEMQLGQSLLPRYQPIPEGMDAVSYLRHLCEEGLRRRYGSEPSQEAWERLKMELDVIEETGFAAYFLIVWDFMRAARCDGVKVGPGRGSAAGSLVAYVLEITNLDPLRYNLLFERFLNRERVSMPDIDIDFDDKRRDRVIAYVQEKYGSDRVAQIITFGTMAARAAIRDVGRVLDVPLSEVDRLAKLIPQSVGITLDDALKQSRDLRQVYDEEPWAKQVIDNARRLEGICRNASTHAAGVVIAPEPLANIVPLQRSTSDRESIVTQFDMNGVQKIGLLKMDFLGLSNLTIIDDALQFIKQTRDVDIDIDQLPLDDEATYALFGRADTHGIFQFEAAGAKKILIDMQPQTLEDLSAANALNRPGPIEGGVIDIYMRRKRGEEQIEYLPGLAEKLHPVLAETHGTIVYQEQVMMIAQAVAGFSLAEADILRAAMGKKDKVKMATQREQFLRGAVEKGTDEEVAGQLFDLIAFFAGYGFNKSHSTCYALVAYQTAYLKANYPLEYMAALLNSRGGDFDKLKQTILDARARGLDVRPPDVNRSIGGFSVGDLEKREILYGLHHIKNVGEKVIDAVLDARAEGGTFTSLLDLCERVGSRDMNRRVLEALIRSGACDCLGERAALLAVLDQVLDRVAQVRRERDSGQTSLFGGPVDTAAEDAAAMLKVDLHMPSVTPTPDEDRLLWEKEFLGMYLSDHPLRRVEDELRTKTDTMIGELGAHLDGCVVQVGGALRDVRAFVPKRSTSGQRMAVLQLEDMSGSCEVVVFARTFEDCVEVLRTDGIVVVRGKVEATPRNRPGAAVNGNAGSAEEDRPEPEQPTIIAEAVFALEDVRLATWRSNRSVHVSMHARQLHLLEPLRAALQRSAGDTTVILHVEDHEKVIDVSLAEEFNVDPSPGLTRDVEALLGPHSFRVEVRRDRAPEREGRRSAARRS
jgi:DNA polymerase-3 subunit alpha